MRLPDKCYELNTIINGLQVNVEYDSLDVREVFVPLLRKLSDIQKEKDRRIIAFLAAPPGLGKTTLTHFLQKLSTEIEGVTELQAAGMDGFHHYAKYLKSHTTFRDGKEILMDEIKGAPETFDVNRLESFLKRLLTENSVLFPTYDRTKHDVIDDGYVINKDIILLEGNYLLLSDKRWEILRKYADFTIYAYTDISVLKPRLIERKIMSGHDPEESEKFFEFSDGKNAELVLNDFPDADFYLEFNNGRWKGNYKIEK